MSDDLRSDPKRAREYSRAKIAWLIGGILFSWAGSALFLFSGSSRTVTRKVSGSVKGERTGEGLTILVFTLLSWIVSLPIAYLRGYRLEHRFGMSNQTHATWFGEQLKSLGLQLVFMIPVTQAVLAIIRKRPRDWWAVLSGLAIPFTVIMAQLFPVLIAPIFNKYQPLQDRELAERLKALAARSGIQVAEIMEMDMSRQTKAANAMYTGIGPTKRIVLSDTLLNEFTYDEIETIVAHETGHQAHRDLWRLLSIGTATTALIAWMTQRGFEAVNRRTSHTTGIRGAGFVEALPLLSLVGSLAGMLLMPLQNAFSRYIERQADRYAIELTEKPEAFASALERLKVMNLSNPDPSRLEVLILHSHPPITERVESARRAAT